MRSYRIVLTMALLFALDVMAGEPPETRLYVRTIPPGAKVVLDGKELGLADGLFIVLPGDHTVTLELEGYAPEKRDVNVPTERITRLVVTLVKRGEAAENLGEGADKAGGEAALALISKAQLAGPVRDAMMVVLRQHPAETRWSGRSGTTLFAIAVKSVPAGAAGQRALAAFQGLTHSLAVQELLKAKSLLDLYAEAGLTDATTLRQAVVDAAGELEVTGSVQGVTHQAAVQGGYAVAYVIGEEKSLSAHLLQPAELEKVQAAYRTIMHNQARELMKQGNWKDAILLWHHLHTRKLVSQALYLDAARCFIELKQPDEAMKILQEAYKTFSDAAPAEWLEECGDLACKLGQPGEALAVAAYQKASAQLMNTVTGKGGDQQ